MYINEYFKISTQKLKPDFYKFALNLQIIKMFIHGNFFLVLILCALFNKYYEDKPHRLITTLKD